MTDIEKKLEIVKEELYSDSSVMEYFRLKKAIEENEELKKLDIEIRKIQKEVCRKNNKQNILDDEKLKELKAKFDNHPLIVNYNKVKEEVFSLLNEIKEVF